ncbi:MAG: sulfite exporter TauE/SafE family protein [Deltaproteobacteria bacterium]|nr:sulfite exporter TauE/SafE family protein [Deltaproteobacteria bacterium]
MTNSRPKTAEANLFLSVGRQIRHLLLHTPQYLVSWLIADALYILVLSAYLGQEISLTLPKFILVHLLGVAVGTMVMFSGIGAGVLWIPVLTLLDIRPAEAVSISIFTQIAGKGMGSLTYLLTGLVDLAVAKRLIPLALLGVGLGYFSGFYLSFQYERLLLYIFLIIAVYLLVRTVQSLYRPAEESKEPPSERKLTKSYPVAVFSSFFTGLLSIGNTDWLIPHMEQKLGMPTHRAVATGLFIMFATTLFYLLLMSLNVWAGFRAWPPGTPLLFATCSGVVVGGQFGTRLTRYPWFRGHQKHAFILMLTLSIIHLLW